MFLPRRLQESGYSNNSLKASLHLLQAAQDSVYAHAASVWGVILGIIVASVTTAFVPDSFIDALRIPLGSLMIYVTLCVGCAVVAATLPARRAARLKILDAIAIPT